VKASLAEPNFLLKIIPHVDGTPRICELVEYYLTMSI
jgi:acetoacetate decarboxylase